MSARTATAGVNPGCEAVLDPAGESSDESVAVPVVPSAFPSESAFAVVCPVAESVSWFVVASVPVGAESSGSIVVRVSRSGESWSDASPPADPELAESESVAVVERCEVASGVAVLDGTEVVPSVVRAVVAEVVGADVAVAVAVSYVVSTVVYCVVEAHVVVAAGRESDASGFESDTTPAIPAVAFVAISTSTARVTTTPNDRASRASAMMYSSAYIQML